MKRRLNGFTLIELSITTMILWFLVIVLFNVYIITGQIAVKIQSERWLHNETLFVMQTIQNIVDNGDLSITWYSYTTLGDTYGIVDELVFTLDGLSYTLSRACESTWWMCYLQLEKFDPFLLQTDYLHLTDTKRVNVTNFYVKLVPFWDQTDFDNISHLGFWLFLDIEIPHYSDEHWWFRVRQQLQTFFNVRQY